MIDDEGQLHVMITTLQGNRPGRTFAQSRSVASHAADKGNFDHPHSYGLYGCYTNSRTEREREEDCSVPVRR